MTRVPCRVLKNSSDSEQGWKQEKIVLEKCIMASRCFRQSPGGERRVWASAGRCGSGDRRARGWAHADPPPARHGPTHPSLAGSREAAAETPKQHRFGVVLCRAACSGENPASAPSDHCVALGAKPFSECYSAALHQADREPDAYYLVCGLSDHGAGPDRACRHKRGSAMWGTSVELCHRRGDRRQTLR